MIKHNIGTLCLLGLVVGLLVFAGAGPSLSASPPKATGGVGFTTTDDDGNELKCRVEFNAHAGDPAKGKLNYRDANGGWFRVDIQCVHVLQDSAFAFFSGPIVSASDSALVGHYLLVAVHDGGTPGKKGDRVWGEMFEDEPECEFDYWPGDPGDDLPVESGNLVVH
ncbi:MAG: hypothetical protein AMJ73_04470 [candidate division Zixibacteria bacterium SM1_73]|nr:MAG: hypothetical protein AMJ73_04470 [candidate division Zixibacteria bacterium SM1_73]